MTEIMRQHLCTKKELSTELTKQSHIVDLPNYDDYSALKYSAYTYVLYVAFFDLLECERLRLESSAMPLSNL